jgi:hypothetical protein
MMAHRDGESVRRLFDLSFGKRPEEELYAMEEGYACLKNLADDPEYAEIGNKLRDRLETELLRQGDPRMKGLGSIFDTYPYYGQMTADRGWTPQPGFREQGKYNPEALR